MTAPITVIEPETGVTRFTNRAPALRRRHQGDIAMTRHWMRITVFALAALCPTLTLIKEVKVSLD